MADRTERVRANMEVVLEETCKSLPNGGGHEVRAFIAQRLAEAAGTGGTTIGYLRVIARKAMADYESGAR